jgi:hypothetical protein
VITIRNLARQDTGHEALPVEIAPACAGAFWHGASHLEDYMEMA